MNKFFFMLLLWLGVHSPIFFKQSYKASCRQIDIYQQKGLPGGIITICDKILKKAAVEKNYILLIKAFNRK